jgi:hypothetical protein
MIDADDLLAVYSGRKLDERERELLMRMRHATLMLLAALEDLLEMSRSVKSKRQRDNER